MTIKTLNQIKELHSAGYVDREIAEELGISQTNVHYWRSKLGLEPNRTNRWYAIYDRKTSDFIFEGRLAECCEFLGLTLCAFRRRYSRFKTGAAGKYEIYEVEA